VEEISDQCKEVEFTKGRLISKWEEVISMVECAEETTEIYR
jgi:hypothetical protein